MLIRGCEVEGRVADVRIRQGRIEGISTKLSAEADEQVLDAGGGALLPGLHDHHLHLFGLAAALRSLPCGPPQIADAEALAQALAQAEPEHGWIRGMGYHEAVAGDLDRAALDALRADLPVRIQHRSGSLWMLNSAALEALEAADRWPDGRLFRADRWLRERLAASDPPGLGPATERLLAVGITGFTDAGADNGPQTAAFFAAAQRSGKLPQRFRIMGGADLAGAERKILLDEPRLPPFAELVAPIREAHEENRGVAIHAVTRTELVMALGAIAEAGAHPGDRIEHAAVAPPEAIELAAELGITVVLQPGFVHERGDSYLRDVEARDRPWLLRGRAWLEAGVPIAAGSDAPYGAPDPWRAMAAAVDRRTREGAVLGPDEALTPEEALALFSGSLEEPAGRPRRVEAGQPADLCLLSLPWKEAREALASDLVVATLCAGKLVARRSASRPGR
ncbi:MAG: amidohydrolase family protein [Deltaproteobacteria bacterium]|nr:amidohydrolase family protein [Deltaproteobacteria bacterium]